MNTYTFSKSVSDALNLHHENLELDLIEGIDYIPYDRKSGWYNNTGSKNGFYGLKHSEETLQKMRKPKSSTIKMSYPKSQTHKDNMSKARKGLAWTDHNRHSRIAKCKHCGLETIKTNITRFHNDKCKLIEKIL